ncbi:MAG: trypsin-like peptidase domain-containing protein [Tannerellaceae bacterium]|jgi:S1-C subfamily serine protease|nr:trypsin-like peptidase domain-containing protein [Tannerellaceae bacterium]
MKLVKEFLGYVQYKISRSIDWYQFLRGLFYFTGDRLRLISEDHEEAVYWFRKAAEQDYADAQYYLGVCYHYGKGINQNIEQAEYWYRKAAYHGQEDAQKALVLFEKGEDINQDFNTVKTKARKNVKKNKKKRIIFDCFINIIFPVGFVFLGFWIIKGLSNGISSNIFGISLTIVGALLWGYAIHFKRKMLILGLALISIFGFYTSFGNVTFPKKPSVITMTTDSKDIKFYMAGSASISIDWGDGKIEKITLPEDQYYNKKFSRSYLDESFRTITVKGNISRLICSSNKLISLDVSKNAELIELDCSNNLLTSLELSNNSAMKWLNCSENQLTNLDIRKNRLLIELNCYYNAILSLDVSKNLALTNLYCGSNQLASLDVSKNTALIELGCNYNAIPSLDVSKNLALTNLYCASNQLASLDVSKNTALKSLNCYGNQLTELDISKNTGFTNLYLGNNKLNSFNINNNSHIECDEVGNYQMIFSEYFNSEENPNQWKLLNDTSSSSKILSGKGLLMENKNADISFQSTILVPINSSENFSIETTVNFIKGNDSTGYGLVWGFKDWNNYYTFLITADGYYKIGYMYNGNSGDLKEWTKTPHINKNTGGNLIKINSVDYVMSYYINGENVFTGNVYDLKGNYTGFFVHGEIEILFENLIVKRDVTIPRSWLSTPSKQSDISWHGTGFFIDKRGYIATNHHVIERASEIEIEFNRNGQKQTYKAKVINEDPTNDLAILKIDDNSFTPLTNLPYNFQTNTSQVGTSVFTLGYPLKHIMGTEIKYNDGTITSRTGWNDDPRNYQVSVPIHSGNSGGPLFDNNGNLIGITCSILDEDNVSKELSRNVQVQNVSYAVKSSYLNILAESLPEKLNLPRDRTIASKTREEKIEILKDYVVSINVR